MMTRKIKYDLYLLGWHSFQQLCIQIARTVLGQTIESYLEIHDGGKDGAFKGEWKKQGSESYSGKFIIQCKHTSSKDEKIALALLDDELVKAAKLVANGECDIYVLMTNLKVSGVQKTKIEAGFKAIGVKDFVLLGSDWICEQIVQHKSLRTSVPRLYGLGDLSEIIDERAYSQANALIKTISHDLGKVVITSSYKKSAEALNQHGFVLLIGEPAAGKTTIAYMLAMAAMDQWGAQLIAVDNAEQMVKHWNAENPERQMFWIDDAFGITQYESDMAYQWNRVLPKIQSMLKQGIKIVMTSRNYIYERARKDLKTSAFPLFQEGQVVVDVHALTFEEKKQILYNHLKLGTQPKEFLTEIKPLLIDVAKHDRFVPEVARRLGDPLFTKDLYLGKYHLNEFVEKQEQFLIEIIEKLDQNCKASLGLVYMRANKLQSPVILTELETAAIERMGGNLSGCLEALNSLKGTLVALAYHDDESTWRFKHPTVGDAFSKVVIKDPELLDIFLTGSSTDELLYQITCGNLGFEKAVVIPKSYFPEIVKRLNSFTESTSYKSKSWSVWQASEMLYRFLATRCSKDFLQLYLTSARKVLSKISEPSLYLDWSADVQLVKRLHVYDILPDEHRKKFIDTITKYAIDGQDFYALQDTDVRRLFSKDEYSKLQIRVIDELVPNLTSVRLDHQREIDQDTDPEEGMSRFLGMLESIKELSPDNPILITQVEKQRIAADEWIEEERDKRPDSMEYREFDEVDDSSRVITERNIFDDIDL